MNQTANSDYTLGSASIEIILLVVGAFLLGALLCYLLKLLGLCCRQPRSVAATDGATASGMQTAHHDAHIAPAHTQLATPGHSTAVNQPHNGRIIPPSGDSSFEADIHSLLRSGNTERPLTPAATMPDTPSPSSASFEHRVKESLGSDTGLHTTSGDVFEMPDDGHVDDLKRLEGIGPRIEKLLNDAGISSYARLATMDREHLKRILQAGGREFKMHEPKSWPYQAELAAKQNWSRLKEYQDFLQEGRNNL